MQVCLQGQKENTCVACAVVNVLRHFLLDPNADEVVEAMKLPNKHGKDGSNPAWASKYLRREWNMDCLVSRPPFTIINPEHAAVEIAYRYEVLLADGRVGLIDRKETPTAGHMVVLHKVLWERGEPYFVTYDSNKRQAGGHWVYRVQDYVFWTPDKVDVKINLTNRTIETEQAKPEPTGRIGYFVRPSTLKPLQKAPERSPFRARKTHSFRTNTGADGPPGG